MIEYKVIDAPSYAESLETVHNMLHADEGWILAGIVPSPTTYTQIILHRERNA